VTAIAGFWSFGAEDTAASCERMLRSQAIYGTHGTSVWKGGEISIGRALHRSLPEDSYDRGPQTGGSGLALVADVRLDNRDELVALLGLADARAQPDAAILLRALEQWGEDAVERLNGDFAFALWDPNRRRLTLARDYLGQRPLHYHQGRDLFAFASMAKGLHALPDIPYAPDIEIATNFVALMPETGSRTFFAGIHKVEAGQIVTVTPEGVTSRKYWRPNLEPLTLKNDQEYAEALRAQLDRAVRVRLRGAENRVASTLSGGLDSSAVTATAARLVDSNAKVIAFTSVPREDYELPSLRGSFGDERAHAAAVAALYDNIEHVLVPAGGLNPLTQLDRNFFLNERPVLNICNQSWYHAILDGARQRGCPVLLIGSLGNMSFSYQGMDLLTQLLARGRLIRFSREALALRRNGTRLGTIASQSLGPYLPERLWTLIGRIRGRGRSLTDYSAIRPDIVTEVRSRAAERGLDTSYRPWRSGVAARLWSIGRVDRGNYNKGVLGGWGIDVRDPTADRELMEFCLRVPSEQYLAKGTQRALARRALADRLPPIVTEERRKGYQAVDWHEGLTAAREELREEVGRIASAGPALEALDAGKMQALIDDWPEGGWHKPEVFQPYRLALLRGVSAGHFIRKAAQSNQ
jgi:asparagine synthase (glutamine-hydrolysing)